MVFFISYLPQGRLGNNLFQYITCKLLECILPNLKYTFDYNVIINLEHLILTEDDYIKLIFSQKTTVFDYLKNKNILCNGYFQNENLLIKYRHKILNSLDISDDFFQRYDRIYPSTKDIKFISKINYFLRSPLNFDLYDDDIVLSLRLDDFINSHNLNFETSILPYTFYTEILDKIEYNRVIIVCDILRESWEHKYIKKFSKYNPIILHQDLESDIAILRNCKRLIHSNSTMCWFFSFISHKIERYIPNYSFVDTQKLTKIVEKDFLIDVVPMKKLEIENL